jgi:hypothetical protein
MNYNEAFNVFTATSPSALLSCGPLEVGGRKAKVTARSDACTVVVAGLICDTSGGSVSGDTWPESGGGT